MPKAVKGKDLEKVLPELENKNLDRDDALRKWQADFNKEVLEPKGMSIKSQSKVRAHGGDEQKERWFFIALNNEEATKLKAEEHILGAAYPIGVCVSSGMHEKDFCCQQPTY